jgi:hypothetical protein
MNVLCDRCNLPTGDPTACVMVSNSTCTNLCSVDCCPPQYTCGLFNLTGTNTTQAFCTSTTRLCEDQAVCISLALSSSSVAACRADPICSRREGATQVLVATESLIGVTAGLHGIILFMAIVVKILRCRHRPSNRVEITRFVVYSLEILITVAIIVRFPVSNSHHDRKG